MTVKQEWQLAKTYPPYAVSLGAALLSLIAFVLATIALIQ